MDQTGLCCFGGRKEVAVKGIVNARLLCEELMSLGESQRGSEKRWLWSGLSFESVCGASPIIVWQISCTYRTVWAVNLWFPCVPGNLGRNPPPRLVRQHLMESSKQLLLLLSTLPFTVSSFVGISRNYVCSYNVETDDLTCWWVCLAKLFYLTESLWLSSTTRGQRFSGAEPTHKPSICVKLNRPLRTFTLKEISVIFF